MVDLMAYVKALFPAPSTLTRRLGLLEVDDLSLAVLGDGVLSLDVDGVLVSSLVRII